MTSPREKKIPPIWQMILATLEILSQMIQLHLDKPFPWSVGFFFGELELSMNLWGVTAKISRLDDYGDEERRKVAASSKCFRASLKISSVHCLKRGWLRKTFKQRVNNHSNRASVFVERLPHVLIRSTC